MLVWPAKDPDEDVLNTVDWSRRLGTDIISDVAFEVTSGDVTVSDGEHDGARLAQVLVSGGTAGTKAKVLCEITTVDGQLLQETATLLIRAR
jgi:hypothetical protein